MFDILFDISNIMSCHHSQRGMFTRRLSVCPSVC